jgi:hypothetical protein
MSTTPMRGESGGALLTPIPIYADDHSPPPALRKPEKKQDETDADRRAREEAESEALARQMMEEEALNSYQSSMEALRAAQATGAASGISPEDLAAMEAAMRIHDAEDEEYAPDEGEGDFEGMEHSRISEMDYDQLMQLGDAIGDVKKERWALNAQNSIEALPSWIFGSAQRTGRIDAITEKKCIVCMSEYENGEEVKELPCAHLFHSECVGGWLTSNDNCPLVRVILVAATLFI